MPPTRLLALLFIAIAVVSPRAAVARGTAPTIDQLVGLKRVQGPTAISPDGRWVAYAVRETNWDDNAFETEIWIADVSRGVSRQLTNAPKSSSAPAWSSTGLLAFLSDRRGKQQIFRIDPRGGEADALTVAEDGVTSFAWSPDGRSIAYVSTDAVSPARKTRDAQYGEFEVVDQDHRMAQLYVYDVAAKTVRQATHGAFVVGRFAWSPDSREIAFDHRVNNDPANGGTADISVVSIADGVVRDLVSQEGPDSNPMWSPDGSRIAFESAMANPWYYFMNGVIAVVPASGGTPVSLTTLFDESPSLVAWAASGIYFSASQRTWSYLFRLNPTSNAIARLAPSDAWIGAGFSLSKDETMAAFTGSDAHTFGEVYAAPLATMAPKKLSDLGAQIAGWTIGRREVISWKSQDGATVEGVLHKPADFTAGRRYPLLVVIHGGPTGVSRPAPLSSTQVYPIDIWLSKGALVLEPNYRGSAGYGEAFRALNVRNLGVGDAWDVLTGVDALIAQGLVDRDRVGAMGWSQGGYISAFLSTHDSARFKAISVGAGISNWTTYYVNTDIHPFTRQYLKSTPWDDPEIYKTTSPISYVKQARTPTLIQHGDLDPRVPIPNAYELYQGLQDQGTPTRLIVYKGFGHGLNKPKAVRAALEHNYEWFEEYFFNAARSTTDGK